MFMASLHTNERDRHIVREVLIAILPPFPFIERISCQTGNPQPTVNPSFSAGSAFSSLLTFAEIFQSLTQLRNRELKFLSGITNFKLSS